LCGIHFDPAGKLFFSGLSLIKVCVTLVATIHDGGFAFFNDLFNKGTFTFFAIGQVYLAWYATVDIKFYMSLGLFGSTAMVAHTIDRTESIKERSIETTLFMSSAFEKLPVVIKVTNVSR